MKVFTEPIKGRFIIKVPTEWQYSNINFDYEQVSPFSFQLYENHKGAFQISCYSDQEKPLNPNIKRQSAETDNLEFVEQRMDGGGFNVHLWYAVVEDHAFMAKYIYDSGKASNRHVKKELGKVKVALSTLQLLKPETRKRALEFDRYENFIASLAASFDLKNRALDNGSVIELIIIIANQIDAYLRMALTIKKQLDEKADDMHVGLLFQGESDVPIMERKVYKLALDEGFIQSDLFDRLEELYKKRNKVVHRYIISDFKTRDLYKIAYDYEAVCEEVRLLLKNIEDLHDQYMNSDHSQRRQAGGLPNEADIRFLHSQVNDKHLIKELRRKIE
jgi:hypothetical protein